MTNNKPNYVQQLHTQKDHHLTAVTGAGVLLGSTILLGQQSKVHAAENSKSASDHTMIVSQSAASSQQVQLHPSQTTSATKSTSQAASTASQTSEASTTTASAVTSQTQQSQTSTASQTTTSQQVASTATSENATSTEQNSSAKQVTAKSQAATTNTVQSTATKEPTTTTGSQVSQVSTSQVQSQASQNMTTATSDQQSNATSATSQSSTSAVSQISQQSTASNASQASQQSATTIASQQTNQVVTNATSTANDTTKAQDLQQLQQLLQLETTSSANNYQEAFINKIANAAVTIANKYGLYPSVMMAQAILESGWGQSGLSISANNYFGVKGSYNGQSVNVPTQEWNGYQMVTINDYFKKYPNAEASFEDYAQVFVGSDWARNFYRGVFRKNAPTYQDATAWLTGRYATDPSYNVKLNQIIAQYDLSRFDQQTTNTPDNVSGEVDTDNTNADTTKPQTQKTYIVKSGDTVWGISQQFNTTVSQIVSWNNLTDANKIYVGQVLNVSAPVTQQDNNQSTTTNTDNNSQTNDETVTYTVKSGDTLWGISQKFQVSVPQITSLNHISDSNIIYVGQVLTIKQGNNSQSNNNTNNSSNSSTTTDTNQNANNGTVTYTVKSGDTLWGISQQYNTTVSHLQDTNHLSGSTIYVGQKLVISGNQQTTNTTSQTTNNNTSSNQTTTYTVKSGDTLWGISQKYNTSVNQLMSANHLSDTTIYTGQVLDIAPVASGNVTLSRPNVQQNSAYYTAKSGDSLWSIAQANNTSVSNLKQLNNLSSDMILVGQRLRVR